MASSYSELTAALHDRAIRCIFFITSLRMSHWACRSASENCLTIKKDAASIPLAILFIFFTWVERSLYSNILPLLQNMCSKPNQCGALKLEAFPEIMATEWKCVSRSEKEHEAKGNMVLRLRKNFLKSFLNFWFRASSQPSLREFSQLACASRQNEQRKTVNNFSL